MTDFRLGFEAFCRTFNGERNFIVPLLSLNTKGISEMQQEARTLIESFSTLTRIHYVRNSKRIFSISDLVLPLCEFKTLTIAASLRQFSRPDRFGHLIQFSLQIPIFLPKSFILC
jgi:hypothetical protein